MVDASEKLSASSGAIPVVVIARQQEQVEFINSTLRKAGHAVHCHWVDELNDLSDALGQINAQMILAICTDADDTTLTLKALRQHATHTPVLLVRDHVDETLITEAMQSGARDVVSLSHPQRLQAVVSRELHSFRLERKLATTLQSTQEYRAQLKQLMSGSADAIVHVQEGIIVNPNPAWLKLLGHQTASDMDGLPVMDFFAAESHASLKGALAACLHGKWSGHALKVSALLAEGGTLALELRLQQLDIDGEPAVQLLVPSQRQDDRPLELQVNDALERDAATGLLQWKFFIEQLRTRLAQPLKGGVRELVCLQPDKFDELAKELGPAQIEEFMAHLVGPIKGQLHPNDLAGRFGAAQLFVLLERGTRGDVEAWCNHATHRIAELVFAAGGKSLTCTCTAGISLPPAQGQRLDLDRLITDAMQGTLHAQQEGGNRIEVVDHLDEDTKQHANDKLWVRLIKAALMENRFRLLQQPIVTLSGEDKGMCDVLVRMLDELNQEVVPSEFLAAAERNDLMKNIDRWVIGAAMSFAGTRKVDKLFVRLTRDSVLDKSLPTWLDNQLRATHVDPGRIVFEVNEAVASNHLAQTQALATHLRKMGFRFALEHVGHARDPVQLIQHLPLDYMKIDGSLMQGLSTDLRTQTLISSLLEAARKQNISTIAERVEDANTMAVLWQLGLQYVQGYFMHEPERVILG